MALIHCDFFAETLELSTSMTVILPQQTRTQIGLTGAAAGPAGAPVLYLLHGLSDDHTSWARHTSIERYTALKWALRQPHRFAAAARLTGDFRAGEHEWGFWDEEIRQVLAWLPLS